MNYWLLKSEPSTYSLNDLQREGNTLWDGVRNYQARNFLRQMSVGDWGFFYHSNAKPPGIVGLMRVVEIGLTDPTQFDPDSPYYDPKATAQAPRWQTVRVEFVRTWQEIVTLDILKQQFLPEELAVVRRGCRLSVMPVPGAVAQRLLAMGEP
jgi:predicted RNA-binding protein with PUA-like domain